MANAYYQNCRLTLDSARDDERINSLVRSKFPTIEFRNCLIVYRGGEFALILWSHVQAAPLHMLTANGKGAELNYDGPSLQFISCQFDFSVSNQVPQRGKETLQTLLTQNGPSLALAIQN
jgi:hypothetical protein